MLGLNDEMDSLMLREWKVGMCMECAGEKRSDANSSWKLNTVVERLRWEDWS